MILNQTESKYNEWHNARNEADEKYHVLNDPWYQTVMQILPDLSNKKVLEIGTGRGDFGIWLAKRFPTAVIFATDFSEKAISIAKEKSIDEKLNNLFFSIENAECLTFTDGEFDYVISCETMEHVFNPQLMANEIYRVLKNRGLFILTTENYFNGMSLAWLNCWITKKPFNSGSGVQPHENYFLFYKVASFLKKAGLSITHTQSNYFQWLLLPGVNPSKLCTKNVENKLLKKVFKPFGRHFTYVGKKEK